MDNVNKLISFGGFLVGKIVVCIWYFGGNVLVFVWWIDVSYVKEVKI